MDFENVCARSQGSPALLEILQSQDLLAFEWNAPAALNLHGVHFASKNPLQRCAEPESRQVHRALAGEVDTRKSESLVNSGVPERHTRRGGHVPRGWVF